MEKWTEDHCPLFHSHYYDGYDSGTSSLERQVHPAGLPGIVNLHQNSADQAQASRFVGKDAHHPGSAVDFPADPLQAVGGAEQAPVSSWEGKHGQSFRDVLLPANQPV